MSYTVGCPEAIMHGPVGRAGRCPWEHRYLMGLRS
jgi:hypothetical protein